MKRISVEELERILPMCCDEKTAYGDGWTADNPLYGHCAVVALLAQDFFGGVILSAAIPGGSHYWNFWYSDTTERDFTAAQFKDSPPTVGDIFLRTRDSILSNPDTKKRYELFRARFLAKILN